eukprot:CAMPEP_0180677804 /NCGR_PEP_ID=MMETSP1037_2-20121125/68045_1 /TAXON_ID=632150 /ORGANISM="Azadinium spinosum, Strain 3D9" /LENGTH=105 /DNA_ID=CAMNT_0022707407 /DNA_START=93 /DNA_END=407 /DNA_ORIENTATION=+
MNSTLSGMSTSSKENNGLRFRNLRGMSPDSAIRRWVDLFRFLCLLWDWVVVPYVLAWDAWDDSMQILKVSSWTTRLFWTLDIPISFVSGYWTADQDGGPEVRLSK